jgi:hypothetical protein
MPRDEETLVGGDPGLWITDGETVRAAERHSRFPGGQISVSVAGRTGPPIALLLPGSDPLLGVETLEALGLKVNPEKRRLEPSRTQTALLVGA